VFKLKVNGATREVDPAVGRTLAETLREDIGLTGTKIACGEGHCGDEACCNHEFRGAANVPLTNEEIEITVAAHRGVAVGPDREDRTFDNQCGDSRGSKVI
jgi:hypothetical protein